MILSYFNENESIYNTNNKSTLITHFLFSSLISFLLTTGLFLLVTHVGHQPLNPTILWLLSCHKVKITEYENTQTVLKNDKMSTPCHKDFFIFLSTNVPLNIHGKWYMIESLLATDALINVDNQKQPGNVKIVRSVLLAADLNELILLWMTRNKKKQSVKSSKMET